MNEGLTYEISTDIRFENASPCFSVDNGLLEIYWAE